MKTVREMQQVGGISIQYAAIRDVRGRPTHFTLGGEANFRLARAIHRIENELPYSTEYILSQVSAAPGQWSNYPRFHGDIAGRWVLAETYIHAGDKIAPPDLKAIVDQLIALQNPDGTFGVVSSEAEPLNRHKIYGNGWMLKAMAQYALTFNDPVVREAAERLGHYYERSFPLWSQARQATARDEFYAVSVHGYYHALDGLITLYDLTQDESWLALAGRFVLDLVTLSEADHSHMYLTSRRGLLHYYRCKGMTQAIADLAEELHECYRSCLLEMGGVPERFWLPDGQPADDEGCSLFDWSILTSELYEVTGDPRWLQYAALNLENHIYYNQIYNGGFGSYQLDTCYHQQGKEAPWCCSLFAPFGLIETTSTWVQMSGDHLHINHLVSGEFSFADGETVIIHKDDEHGVLTIDTRGAPSIRQISVFAPFWITFGAPANTSNSTLADSRLTIEIAQSAIITIPYQYEIWLSGHGKAPQQLTHIPDDQPFVLFYGPWLLCHRFPVQLPEKVPHVLLALNEHGQVVNAHIEFLLGMNFYGEGHRITLPSDHVTPASDAARSVFEQPGALYSYPLKDKESPGHGYSALSGSPA